MMLVVFLALAFAIVVFFGEETGDTEDEILCPCCSRHISSHYQYCPHCRFMVKSHCSGCGKAVNWDWRQCPHCAEHLGGGNL